MQIYSGTAVIYATSAGLDPIADRKWSVSVSAKDPKKPELALGEIVILPDSAECASPADCDTIEIEVKSIEAASLGITAHSVGGRPLDILTATSIMTAANADWSVYRLAPADVSRTGQLVLYEGNDEPSTYFFTGSSPAPPSATPKNAPSRETLLTNYKAFHMTGTFAVTIEAKKALYVFVGSASGNGFVKWRLNIDANVASGSPKPVAGASKAPSSGKGGAKIAIIAIASIFGLIGMVGCFVFLTRLDTIRRIYKASSNKRGYAEVTLG